MILKCFLVVSLLMTIANALAVDVICDFRYSPSYACNIRNLKFSDVPLLNFAISGTHLPGHSNDDVSYIIIEASQTPIVITQLFVSFPNAHVLKVLSSGLNRIQRDAFIGGNNLRDVQITGNSLKSLEAHAFFGALRISNLNLQNNQLGELNVDALYGLHSLHTIDLSNNMLQILPSNLFLWRRLIRRIDLNNNKIEILPGDIFQDNPAVNTIALSNNNIIALGRNLITRLNELTRFEILNNRCVDRSWAVGAEERTRLIPEALEECFRNYEQLSS